MSMHLIDGMDILTPQFKPVLYKLQCPYSLFANNFVIVKFFFQNGYLDKLYSWRDVVF